MSKRYHLPDWVIDGLADGSVDHLDYTTANVARVVMVDGTAQDISIEATPEIIHAELERMLTEGGSVTGPIRIKVQVSRTNWHGRITGWTK